MRAYTTSERLRQELGHRCQCAHCKRTSRVDQRWRIMRGKQAPVAVCPTCANELQHAGVGLAGF